MLVMLQPNVYMKLFAKILLEFETFQMADMFPSVNFKII